MNNTEKKDILTTIRILNNNMHSDMGKIQNLTKDLISDYENKLIEKDQALNNLRKQLNTVIKQRDTYKSECIEHIAENNALRKRLYKEELKEKDNKKYDVTFKMFDKVLVSNNNDIWVPALFHKYINKTSDNYAYQVMGGRCYLYCKHYTE